MNSINKGNNNNRTPTGAKDGSITPRNREKSKGAKTPLQDIGRRASQEWQKNNPGKTPPNG